MDKLSECKAASWMDVLRGASDRLFTVLCETSTASLKEHDVVDALAESILDRVKESPNYIWYAENGKSYITIILIDLTCGRGMDQRPGNENDVQRCKFYG